MPYNAGRPSSRGAYCQPVDPTRFNNDVYTFVKDTRSELELFSAQSNSTGATVYTEPKRVAPAEGFSIYASGTGTTLIETSVDAISWVSLSLITNSNYYSSTAPLPWVRVGLQTGATSMTVWMFRKYHIY